MAFGISADKLALSPAEALSYIESKRNRAARTDSSSGGSQSDWDAMNRAVQASFGPSGKKYVGMARPEYKAKVAKEKADKESALKEKEKKLEAERKLREQREHDRKVKEEQRIYDEKQKEIEHNRKLEIEAGKPKTMSDYKIEDGVNSIKTGKFPTIKDAELEFKDRGIPLSHPEAKKVLKEMYGTQGMAQVEQKKALGTTIRERFLESIKDKQSGFKAGETKTVNGILYERNEQGQWIPKGYIHL